MRSRVMYVEKFGGLGSPGGRIGRVYFSQTGGTLRYRGRALQSLKGKGHKANYFDTKTGTEYWVSGPKRDGDDPLYPGIVEIDDEVVSRVMWKMKMAHSSGWETTNPSPGKATTGGTRRGQDYQEAEAGA